jgi:hypothetical protein
MLPDTERRDSMSARATAHPWLVVAAQFRFNRVLSDELPAQAARVLALGVSVPALEELACLRPEYTDEARALFFVSLRELGIEPPNDIDAFTIVAQSIAADIVAGSRFAEGWRDRDLGIVVA